MKNISTQEGVALILVVSILSVLAVIAVSLTFTMRLEQKEAVNYLNESRATYLTQAGLSHARAILDKDKILNTSDSDDDLWHTTFFGSDVDNDGDGKKDSRWIEVKNNGQAVGRYSVLVKDEAGKLNLNVATRHSQKPNLPAQGLSPQEISLEVFLKNSGISDAKGLSEKIIDFRYGPDKKPGKADSDDNQNAVILANDGLDNSGEGEIDETKEGIDEPEEFNPFYPYADDRPFYTIEELKRIPGISRSIFSKLKNEVTVYSRDKELSSAYDLRLNANCALPSSLLKGLLQAGCQNPWQKAVNISDYADADFSQSVIVKHFLTLPTQDQGKKGDWVWEDGYYKNNTTGGLAGTWSWSNIPAGSYYLYLYGANPLGKIGDVTVDQAIRKSMNSAEGFCSGSERTITIASADPEAKEAVGSLTVNIQNNEAAGGGCSFKYAELISADGKPQQEQKEVRGVEGIRINEIMISPKFSLSAEADQTPGGDWVWFQDHYENSVAEGGSGGRGLFRWRNLPDGYYYLTLYAPMAGQTIGDVYADGVVQEKVQSGERFSTKKSVHVMGGSFTLAIENNLKKEGICYFKAIELSQQPDGEFVELANLTDKEVSLGGWTLEGPSTEAWPATIPLGTTIQPKSYLVLAVDKDDNIEQVGGNNISLQDIWGSLASAQLNFSRTFNQYSDLFYDQAAVGENFLILKDVQGHVVDIQEYLPSQVKSYHSLEKSDPSYVEDSNANGVADNWFLSEDAALATPGKINNNSGINEIVDGEIIHHDLSEVNVKNQPFANLGEIAQVSAGISAFKKFSLEDLASSVDYFSLFSLRLEAEEHKVSGGWSEVLRSPPATSCFESSQKNEIGNWRWDLADRILNGRYLLSLYGVENESFSVSWCLNDGSWTYFTPSLIPTVNGRAEAGIVEIGLSQATSTASNSLELKIKNTSDSQLCHFDYCLLEPLAYVYGRVNINTASAKVLSALPGIDQATAEAIIAARPYGNKDNLCRANGDLLTQTVLGQTVQERQEKFAPISNLITVRSDNYQIFVTAQVLEGNKVLAEKKIQAVVERK